MIFNKQLQIFRNKNAYLTSIEFKVCLFLLYFIKIIYFYDFQSVAKVTILFKQNIYIFIKYI